MLCEYQLQNGKRLGTQRLTAFTAAAVDDLFEKLMFKNVEGKKVERRTTVNHCMKTARTDVVVPSTLDWLVNEFRKTWSQPTLIRFNWASCFISSS
jgi:hypothetical protein